MHRAADDQRHSADEIRKTKKERAPARGARHDNIDI